MKKHNSTTFIGVLLTFMAFAEMACINQGATITLTGRAVNPRKETTAGDYTFTSKTMKRIEAIPQAGDGKDGVQTGFFTSTSKVDDSGNFSVVVSPGVRTLLVGTLEDGEAWQASVDAKEADAALGDVSFVKARTTVLNVCWSGAGDHDIRLLNTSTGQNWGPTATTGGSAEAVLDYDVTTTSGCENITLLNDTGARYVQAVSRWLTTVDFRTVSTPEAKFISSNLLTIVKASPSSAGCGANDKWWAAFAFQNGVVTKLDKCSSDTSSESVVPVAIRN